MATLMLANGGTLRTAQPQQNPSRAQRSTVSGPRSVTLTAGAEGPRVVSFEEIVESQPVVAAASNKLVRQIATLPLKVYRRNSQNERERVIDHPLATLLNQPVPRRGPVNFKQWMARPGFVHGNSLMAKYRGDGPDRPPTNLLPLRWQYVSAYADTGGPIEYWGTTQTGEWRWLPVDETLHFAWESGAGELGVSPLTQLGVTIANEDAAQRYQTASWRNGARPSGAVVLPENRSLDVEERKELREDLARMHEGVDNSFRVALLTGGADWRPMSFDAREAQLIEARTVNREEIAMVYDVPPPMIGDLTHGTYSNVTELHRMLYVTVLRPWLTFFEETLQAQLIDPEPEWAGDDLFVEFDFSEVLRGDPADELKAAADAFANGLMTLNEVRKVLNLPPIGDAGDVTNPANQPHIPANNLQPIGDGRPANGTEPPPVLS
jgi:HK97 family phage portal protein